MRSLTFRLRRQDLSGHLSTLPSAKRNRKGARPQRGLSAHRALAVSWRDRALDYLATIRPAHELGQECGPGMLDEQRRQGVIGWQAIPAEPQSANARKAGRQASVAPPLDHREPPGHAPISVHSEFFWPAGRRRRDSTRRKPQFPPNCVRTAHRPRPLLIGCDTGRKAEPPGSSSTRRLAGPLPSRLRA